MFESMSNVKLPLKLVIWIHNFEQLNHIIILSFLNKKVNFRDFNFEIHHGFFTCIRNLIPVELLHFCFQRYWLNQVIASLNHISFKRVNLSESKFSFFVSLEIKRNHKFFIALKVKSKALKSKEFEEREIFVFRKSSVDIIFFPLLVASKARELFQSKSHRIVLWVIQRVFKPHMDVFDVNLNIVNNLRSQSVKIPSLICLFFPIVLQFLNNFLSKGLEQQTSPFVRVKVNMGPFALRLGSDHEVKLLKVDCHRLRSQAPPRKYRMEFPNLSIHNVERQLELVKDILSNLNVSEHKVSTPNLKSKRLTPNFKFSLSRPMRNLPT